MQVGGLQASASWVTALAFTLTAPGGHDASLLLSVGSADGAVAVHGAFVRVLTGLPALTALGPGSVSKQLMPRLLMLQPADMQGVTCMSTLQWADAASGKRYSGWHCPLPMQWHALQVQAVGTSFH